MNILLTGGAGYIGSHVVYNLIDKGHNVYVIDNLKDSINNSKAILVLTEWDEFKNCDWFKITKHLTSKPFLLDGRNIVDKYYTNKLYSIGI